MDLYEILELTKTATEAEIRQAYRRLALLTHPDRNPSDSEAAEKFKKVQASYDILSDVTKRAEYDSSGKVGKKQYSKPKSTKYPTNAAHGRSIQVPVEITLYEAFTGITKIIKLPNSIPCQQCENKGYTEWLACKKCSGSGKEFIAQAPFKFFRTCQICFGSGRNGVVDCETCKGTSFVHSGERETSIKIPPGVADNCEIRLHSEGDPGKGGKPGDALVKIFIKAHNLFKRVGKDLILDFDLHYSDLVLGKHITFKGLDEKEVSFMIPAGTVPGTVFKLKNRGMPDILAGQNGDIVSKINLIIPTNLEKEHKDLIIKLNKWEQLCGKK